MPTYNEVTVTGFNANPPVDDGSQVAANEVEWQKHLDKIGNPLKTAIEAIDDNVKSFSLAFGALADLDTVGTAQIDNLAVTNAKLATDSVTSGKIAAGAIGVSELATNSVTADAIAADAVGASEIAANAVGTSEIAANAVTATQIAANAVGSSEIAANAVGTSEVDSTVTSMLAKAWVNFSILSGVVTIENSFNVTSVIRNGVGDYSISWTINFANINYVVMGSIVRSAGGRGFVSVRGPLGTGSARIRTDAPDGNSTVEPDNVLVVAFGDQV